MTMPDLDVHLLRCLDVLVQERHVTRAAERMDMSQSGMSTALARLRSAFDDPILVRTPQGMELSDHALEIAGAVRRALNELDLAVARRGPFDPASSSVTFSLMASDYVGLMVLPSLFERLRIIAPRVSLKVTPPQPGRIREALANAEAELVVGFFPDVAEGLYQATIFSDTLACVVKDDHPAIQGEITIGQYAAAEHIFFGAPPSLVSSIEALLESSLPGLGVERRIGAWIPTLAVMPRIISKTDLVATIPHRLATSFAERLGLQVLPLPFELPPLPIRSIWHARMHENNAHRWLRGEIQAVAKTL
jgi:DNA-binding transcriptional LysR family regulator